MYMVHGNHDDIKNILEKLNIEKVDGILLDLGVSSYQLDERERGFSYIGNAILDMRMDQKQELTAKDVVNTYSEKDLIGNAILDMRMDQKQEISAKDVVNTYSEKDLIRILEEYGEERFAKNIAKNIVKQRTQKEIETTEELVNIVKQSIPLSKQKDGHPAKRTFQAIRIEVNNEIEPLVETVKQSIQCLKKGGRLCIIAFHSLEDRAVKQAYIEEEGKCTCPKDLPYCVCGCISYGKIINKKPIIATKEEQEENSRSKSAKLRIFERG